MMGLSKLPAIACMILSEIPPDRTAIQQVHIPAWILQAPRLGTSLNKPRRILEALVPIQPDLSRDDWSARRGLTGSH
jgi:hypothetical protein